MLLRVTDHFHNNPKRIDKLIAVKGLPREWFFRDGPDGPEIKRPWEADIDKNIPHEVRDKCEPMYVIFRYPAMQVGGREIIEKKQIFGLRIDYNSEPGRQMWEDVERYIEESTPRNERIPVAVLCSRDERAAFETYTPHRNTRGSLELSPAPVPLIDLTQYKEVIVEQPQTIVARETMTTVVQNNEPEGLKCEKCEYKHKSKAGIRMHAMKKHPKREKVEV